MGTLPALSGWFIAGFVALRLLGVAFVVLLVARIVVAVRGRGDGAAREIAAQRFASGQVTEEQFRKFVTSWTGRTPRGSMVGCQGLAL